MAKWGEGDPRWIVEERADATNVNNWHWTEKNATAWSKDKLRDLLQGLKITDDKHCCEITEISKLEGEASANNRKAKLIFFYEWDIKAEWKGIVTGHDDYCKGKLEIPNLSEENDAEDIDVTVTTDKDSGDSWELKNFMRKQGEKIVREKLAEYITDLKNEYSKGMILPKKDGENATNNSAKSQTTSENKFKAQINKPVLNSQSSSKTAGVKIPCKKLTEKHDFMCRAEDLYRALTEKDMVKAFTRSDVELEAESGGPFRLFEGNVSGEFVQLERDRKIVMRWRYRSWPDAHHAHTTIELDQKEDKTQLTLTQTGVPESEYDRTKEGWSRYYWEPIKQTFGFGARLF